MKGHTQQQLERNRPEHSAQQCIDFCLKQLYADKTRSLSDTCAGEMTYEELIGALLAARDHLAASDNLDDDDYPDNDGTDDND